MSILELRPDACFRLDKCECGTEDWLQQSTNLCFGCRKGTTMTLTAITIQPPNVAAVQPHSAAFAEYLSDDSRGFVLHTDDDLQLAANIINDIKQRAAEVEAMRVTVTQPINQGLRAFNQFFKPFADTAARAREVWDAKIRAYTTRRDADRRAAEVALQEAIATQDAPRATAAIQAFVPPPKAAGLVLQDDWDFEEFNHDIVPTHLTVLDRRAVLAEIKRQVAEGVREPAIGGLRIYFKQQVKATG